MMATPTTKQKNGSPTKQQQRPRGGSRLFLQDLTPILQANGLFAQYEEYAKGYLRWRQGQAAGARGEIFGPRKCVTEEKREEAEEVGQKKNETKPKTISLLMPGCPKWGDKAKMIRNYFRKVHNLEIEILDAADTERQLNAAPADAENVVIALEKENLVSVVEALKKEPGEEESAAAPLQALVLADK